ncbi:helix-turn-helix domain-containing protein [Lachnospiraceae bacterium ZAX-1]
MSDEDQKQIFSKNLNKLLSKFEKTQKEVADAIGVLPQTFNTWCVGQSIPRMGKVQSLADYFGVPKSDLIDTRDGEENQGYYINDDARELAQFLFENPNYRVLFDASRKVKKEDIEFVKDFLDRMKGDTNDDGY